MSLPGRSLLIAVALASTSTLSALVSFESPDGPVRTRTAFGDAKVNIDHLSYVGSSWKIQQDPHNPDIEWRWSVECEDGAVGCHPAPEPCEEGFAWRPAVDRRTRVPGGEWTEWVKVSRGGCAPVTVPSLDAATVAREFRELPLPKLPPKTQPVGYAVVNLPTILYVTPQRFSEHVLIAGHSVIVEAWPVQYTWDPGDGAAPIVTDHPGEVYPNQTITHTYTERQQVTLSLTTMWAGRFQTSTSGWVDIPGNATTTSKLPLDVKVVRAYLVGEGEPH